MAEAQIKSEDLERWIYDAAEYIARATKGVVMPSRRCGHCSRPAIEHKNADTTDCQQIQLDGNDYCRSLYAEYETLKEFMETLKTGQTAESTIKAFDVKAKGAEKRVKKLERDMEKLQIKRQSDHAISQKAVNTLAAEVVNRAVTPALQATTAALNEHFSTPLESPNEEVTKILSKGPNDSRKAPKKAAGRESTERDIDERFHFKSPTRFPTPTDSELAIKAATNPEGMTLHDKIRHTRQNLKPADKSARTTPKQIRSPKPDSLTANPPPTSDQSQPTANRFASSRKDLPVINNVRSRRATPDHIAGRTHETPDPWSGTQDAAGFALPDSHPSNKRDGRLATPSDRCSRRATPTHSDSAFRPIPIVEAIAQDMDDRRRRRDADRNNVQHQLQQSEQVRLNQSSRNSNDLLEGRNLVIRVLCTRV